MLHRLAAPHLKTLLRDSPAVALLGPRQSGKTTLARALGGRYYDLERQGERARLDLQWEEVEAERELVVLDEAQEHPEVFSNLRGAIDADRKRNGRFLILGSVSPWLMRKVSESLAGRLGLCELSPLLLSEAPHASPEQLWLRGGYPEGGILHPSRFPAWQEGYVALLTERDLPQWGLPARPAVTRRLLRMLAASQGNVWNASAIGRSLGLSHPTVNAYLDYLEGAFLIRRLEPWHGNVRKRLVRNPKVFWRDSGILHALMETDSLHDLYGRPWAGASWEGFVIEQALGLMAAKGLRWRPYFFRTSDGKEIDLVLERGDRRWAVEIKLTTSPGPSALNTLTAAADLIGADRRILVTRTSRPAEGAATASTDLPGFLKMLERG